MKELSLRNIKNELNFCKIVLQQKTETKKEEILIHSVDRIINKIENFLSKGKNK